MGRWRGGEASAEADPTAAKGGGGPGRLPRDAPNLPRHFEAWVKLQTMPARNPTTDHPALPCLSLFDPEAARKRPKYPDVPIGVCATNPIGDLRRRARRRVKNGSGRASKDPFLMRRLRRRPERVCGFHQHQTTCPKRDHIARCNWVGGGSEAGGGAQRSGAVGRREPPTAWLGGMCGG